MNKKEQEIHLKQGTSQEVTNYTSTGYSNSWLGGQTLGKSHPKLSFDGMTIGESLIKNITIH